MMRPDPKVQPRESEVKPNTAAVFAIFASYTHAANMLLSHSAMQGEETAKDENRPFIWLSQTDNLVEAMRAAAGGKAKGDTHVQG